MSRGQHGLETLEQAWSRSDLLFGLLSPKALMEQPIKLRQPFIFYLGHLPAFARNLLLGSREGPPSSHPELDALFARGIDPVGVDEYVPAEPHRWPPADEIVGYREGVREALRHLLDGAGERGDEQQELLGTVIEHELMHHETLLYMAQQLPRELLRPPSSHVQDRPSGSARPRKRVRVPSGKVRLGANRGELPFGWDNEYAAHEVDVESFEIDTLPVTNGDFLEFVETGGFERPELWTEGSWAWRQRHAIRHPPRWQPDGEAWRYRTLFDERPLSDVLDWPASVSWATADAFCRWRGARLPSEAEFHRAAHTTPDGGQTAFPWGDVPPGPEHGNFGFARWSSTPVGSFPSGASAWGVEELVGNGWEWTRTPFGPFPGFESRPHYPGYSKDFFDDDHYVMLGASWATDPRLVRRSFRNWFQPHYPHVFAKFRCVSDRKASDEP
jgi:iron(II)-dependent oxidoreductase